MVLTPSLYHIKDIYLRKRGGPLLFDVLTRSLLSAGVCGVI